MWLHLEGHALSGLTLVPASVVSQLSSLRHLDLGHNLLHAVPPSLSLVPAPGLASLNMDGGGNTEILTGTSCPYYNVKLS